MCIRDRPETPAQIDLQYLISLVVGLISNGIFAYYEAASEFGGQEAEGHGVGVALSGLLIFSLVLAVLNTIRESGGRHSFGIRAFIPWIAMIAFALIRTSRASLLLPSIIYPVSYTHLDVYKRQV